MKFLVVDDEPLARQRLIKLLATLHPEIESLEAPNGKIALEYINNESISTIFLDIRMPVMDGLETASHINKLKTPPVIIFCTAYDEFALDAFNLNAIDYLLKPIAKDALEKTLANATNLNALQIGNLQKTTTRTHISSKLGAKIQLINIIDINYFQCEDKYVFAVTDNDKFIIEEALKTLENEFSRKFIRTHRSVLANISKISGIKKESSKNILLFKNGKQQVEISRRELSSIKKLLI